MRMRRFSAAVAAVAASALVLSACTSGDPAPTDAPETPAATDEEPGGTDEETGAPEEPGDAADSCVQPLGITESADGEVIFTVGGTDWSGFNDLLASTYSTYNSVINGQMRSGFVYFGTDGTICENTDYGTVEVISGLDGDEPLVLEYTISDDAVWSDGEPITINDYLFDWATNNPAFVQEANDGAAAFLSVSGTFAEFVPEGPQGEPGSKSFTVEYAEKYPDWKLVIGGTLPSHVVAEQIGLSSDELAQAILDRDAETVISGADFYNTWTSNPGELPDPAIAPSAGPYQLMPNGWVAGQYLTLEANPNYWGEPAATQRLTFRFLAADQAPSALANGEIHVVEPQATVDTLGQFEQLGDIVTVDTGDSLTWEHLDFNFRTENTYPVLDDEGNEVEGQFLPGSVFADDAGGLALREAFALCVPRQTIVDNLIAPINPDAVVMNAREVFPFQPHYDEVVSVSYDGRYDQVDIAAAQAKVEESGITTPIDVVIGYAAPNPRRADQVSAIKASCDQVGFNIQDGGDARFFDDVLPAGAYDVALFAWAGSGQIASGRNIYQTNSATGGYQNYGMYSNADVDAHWNTLAASLDPAVQLEETKAIEKLLWDTLYGIPVFAHPRVTAYSSGLENVRQTTTQDTVVWNAYQWAWAN